MFGNTRAVATAVAEGLSTRMEVDAVEVGGAPTRIDPDVDLVVVGGPTHALGMSRPQTRTSATEQAEGGVVSTRIGIREWLDAAGKGLAGMPVATFDTRVDRPRLPGSAARAAHRRLRRRGCRSAAAPASFYVSGTTGPLIDGELARAREWGATLTVAV
jgi:hypothetical protein